MRSLLSPNCSLDLPYRWTRNSTRGQRKRTMFSDLSDDSVHVLGYGQCPDIVQTRLKKRRPDFFLQRSGISLSAAAYNYLCLPKTEPGSSVSIVSGYGLDDRAIEVRSPAEATEFLKPLFPDRV
jgi:hypothetical protein